MSWKRALTGPAALALLLTLGNAAKPPVVDDTAYLLFARHLAQHPLDPYGWELNWYREPQPAMSILLPPVLPYYLAAGIRVVGEEPTRLKLWLFPVFLMLTRSAWRLFAQFAPGWERTGTTLVALGPAVLPLANFMLDVPAAALTLAALASKRWITAGVLAGLAMQTKYTALTLPLLLLLLGRAGAVTVAVALFAGWELWVWTLYGESHFLHHVRDQPGGGLWDRLHQKSLLVRPLVAQIGGLAVGWGLLAAHAVGIGRGWLALAFMLYTGTLGVYLFAPLGTDLPPGPVFLPAGCAVLLAVAASCWGQWRSADGRFLLAWVLVELAGYFALTPFPACRRVVQLVLALGFLVAREAGPGGTRWAVACGVGCGVGLLALDVWDARVEPAGVAAAAELMPDAGQHSVWSQGHWGWQYAADRRGWRLAVPGRDTLCRADYLVLPAEPNANGFYRPYHGGDKLTVDERAVEPVGEWVWRDRLAAQTVPNLYGGVWPVERREQPRLRVQVFRVTADFWQPTAGTP